MSETSEVFFLIHLIRIFHLLLPLNLISLILLSHLNKSHTARGRSSKSSMKRMRQKHLVTSPYGLGFKERPGCDLTTAQLSPPSHKTPQGYTHRQPKQKELPSDPDNALDKKPGLAADFPTPPENAYLGVHLARNVPCGCRETKPNIDILTHSKKKKIHRELPTLRQL